MSGDQSPSIHTTAILNNTTWHEDNSLRTLARPSDISRIRNPVRESYGCALHYFTARSIGVFHRVPNAGELRIVGIPQEVVRKFFFGGDRNSARPEYSKNRTLNRKEITAAWRAQGDSFGWGPKEAATLLRQFKREQFWKELKERYMPRLGSPGQPSQDVTASLRRVVPRERTAKPPSEKPSRNKDKDNHHTQSHSH